MEKTKMQENQKNESDENIRKQNLRFWLGALIGALITYGSIGYQALKNGNPVFLIKDVNNDSRADIIMTYHSKDDSPIIYLGQKDGTFLTAEQSRLAQLYTIQKNYLKCLRETNQAFMKSKQVEFENIDRDYQEQLKGIEDSYQEQLREGNENIKKTYGGLEQKTKSE